MNQRIIKLAEQAGLEYDFNPMLWLKYEKFAELIVRECISMIENEAGQYAEPTWAYELINDIKEHFGVEI